MKIYQLVQWIGDGDGVSNCVLYLNESLNRMGYNSSIFTKRGMCAYATNNKINSITSFKDIGIKREDVVFFHYSGATECVLELEGIVCKKVLVFHNVSIPELYRKIDWKMYSNLALGVEEARYTYKVFDRAITLSGYSKQNLVDYGWSENKIDVIPIIPLTTSKRECDKNVLNKYCDGKSNFIHIGRIAPNKKIEDVIHIFEYYQKSINNNTRLLLVGNIQFKNYYDALRIYINDNNINNVEIVGSASREEVEAYYKIADVYICMSEHEGFCLPIIEAFQRSIPVVAYNSTAVPFTMGGAGILVDSKEPSEVSTHIRQLMEDSEYRASVIKEQQERASNFNINVHADVLKRIVNLVDVVSEQRGFSYRFQEGVKQQGVSCESSCNPFEFDYVIYGYGKAGRRLERSLSENERNKLRAICDNGDTFNERIKKHNECVDKYSDCNYIITIQKGYIAVIQRLLNDGIGLEQIYHYDYLGNCIHQ